MQNTPPILVIIGSTASGKSALAVDLALRYGGEVISADSRQVYRSLFYTTGKIGAEEMRGVPHHLLDVVPAGGEYSAHKFMTAATDAAESIRARGNIPVVAGGTGFYINALLYENALSDVPPDYAYREELEGTAIADLQRMLKEAAPAAYDRVDIHNPRRVIRALEIAHGGGEVREKKKRYDRRMVGILHGREHLRERITARLDERFEPMVREVAGLLESGVSERWLDDLGLECRHIVRMLTRGISREETRANLLRAIVAYSKRQETWWRQYHDAVWFHTHEYGKLRRDLDAVYGKR